MLRVHNPLALLLFLPWAAAAWRVLRPRRQGGIPFPGADALTDLPSTWRIACARLCPVLLLLSVGLLIAALARPQRAWTESRRVVDAIAIQMVVDTSGSMQVADMSRASSTGTVFATRLDTAKQAFADFVAQRHEDLIGLITFAGYARTRVPLTADHDALLAVLADVEIPASAGPAATAMDAEEVLTAIGDAVATACAHLRDSPVETRIAVLLSDGESNTGILHPDAAARLAQHLGIRVYTIGIGGTDGAPTPETAAATEPAAGQAALPPGETTLQALAETTGGRYFHASDAPGLQTAMDAIDVLEKRPVETWTQPRARELFPPLLFGALACLLSAMLLASTASTEPC